MPGSPRVRGAYVRLGLLPLPVGRRFRRRRTSPFTRGCLPVSAAEGRGPGGAHRPRRT
ncbi:hypothetical protein QF026_006316 [Streptomyces aurantiacus]|nr:hypothetical protein [Streptomyces aurantiacus]